MKSRTTIINKPFGFMATAVGAMITAMNPTSVMSNTEIVKSSQCDVCATPAENSERGPGFLLGDPTEAK